VPDVYQGDELTFLALVDPDNRRPVDWRRRREALAAPPSHETVKLHTIRELLALRARRPETFAGPYEPLAAGTGTCAFRRGDDVVVAIPVRGETPELELPPGRWRNALTATAVPPDGYGPVVLERDR
jgi:(1->4)-alpha-D-glucan 1-alpha-D-glucosylmutase